MYAIEGMLLGYLLQGVTDTSRKSRPCKSSSFPFTRHHVSYCFECLTLSRVSFVCVFGPSGIRWVFIMIFISSGLRSHRCVWLLSAVTTVSVYQSFGSTLTLSSLYPRSCLTDESCLSFVDTYGVTHDAEKCNKYCCGTCNLRYCCKDKPKQLNQESCSGSLARCGLVFNLFFVMQMWVEIKAFFHYFNCSTSQIGLIVGIAVGSLILLLCVVLIICCLAPCCLCYMKCRKRPTERQISKLVTVTSSEAVTKSA